jgi:alpha-D-xyloside xylohydrolase
MRALCSWISPTTRKLANIPDEYMYGPAFLVAPVTEQGATHRAVYLPAGCDWYNYWTNERLHGGQTITADAPIDTMPLFVKAGSHCASWIGGAERAARSRRSLSVRVYPGANGSFTLFQDDGNDLWVREERRQTHESDLGRRCA